jgi:Icc-related predicted phosphoesterase
MRVVCISDTHGQHKKLALPEGDLLIHAGDATMSGTIPEVASFFKWFEAQPHEHKVFVAGNHDWLFEKDNARARSMVPANVHYLEDSEILLKHGQDTYYVWGSPVQPEFGNWAFNRNQAEIVNHWDLIPDRTDILITHGPPLGILDHNFFGSRCGCWDLRRAVWRTNPKLHVFGHIHESYGEWDEGGVHFVNASQLDGVYSHANKPIVVDLSAPEGDE